MCSPSCRDGSGPHLDFSHPLALCGPGPPPGARSGSTLSPQASPGVALPLGPPPSFSAQRVQVNCSGCALRVWDENVIACVQMRWADTSSFQPGLWAASL